MSHEFALLKVGILGLGLGVLLYIGRTPLMQTHHHMQFKAL